jgi:hypothetical protein
VFSFGTFDHKGPTKKEMDGTSFVLTLAGKGWSEKLAEPTDTQKNRPEKELVVQVSGPELGYVATPICMVQAALVLLREADKLPSEYLYINLPVLRKFKNYYCFTEEECIHLERHLVKLP